MEPSYDYFLASQLKAYSLCCSHLCKLYANMLDLYSKSPRPGQRVNYKFLE